MRFSFAFFTLVFCPLICCSVASACSLAPVADGFDVLAPDILIKEIPNYNPEKPVYAATDVNGWFVRGPGWATEERKKATQLIKEGDCWRAKGLKGIRFHPVQLDDNGKPQWARIENVFPIDSSFVDTSGDGPCLKVN